MDITPNKWLTPRQVADLLGVSVRAVWRLVGEGRLKIIRIAGAPFIRRGDIE